MPHPKILLLGGSGQLGWELRRSLAPLGNIQAPSHQNCDLADAAQVQALLETSRPDWIVNAAAYTAVDKAETETALATRLNGALPLQLARYAGANRTELIHYSTDYVFDGDKPGAYLETDPTNPQGHYGASKLQGETAVLQECPSATVFRLSWVFGMHGGNFVRTMLRLARGNGPMHIIADQTGCPTPAALAADITALTLRSIERGKRLDGLYHLCGQGVISWHAYATWIVDQAWKQGKQGLNIRPEQIVAIQTKDYPVAAKRPANSHFDCSKLDAALGVTLPSWQPYLAAAIEMMP